MKKTTHIRSIAYLVILGLLVSCSDDFLDLKPESDIVSGSFKSAQDAENLLTGAYGAIQSDYNQYDRYYVTEGISDNHYINGDNPQEMLIETFSFDASLFVFQSVYKGLYVQIAAANNVIENVSAIDDPKWGGTNRKEQILGEARFLRALSYYELVTQFGGVPILRSLLNDGNLYPERNTESEVYDLIIEDLEYAEGALDPQPYNGEYGRATKGAAQALLAKTYAQMGDYDNCLAYCNKVIAGPYKLVDDFANLWGVANKNNSESIFEIQQGGTTGWWGFQIFAYAATDGWPKRNICSADLVRAFEEAGDNGTRYATTFDWQVANAPFNMPVNAWDASQPIPFQGKYEAGGWFSQENIEIMRLADIILLAAEAQTQLGHPDLAIPLLNQIRTRAGLPNTTATTQSEVALAVLKERRLELVFECTRWNDLKRADTNGIINVVDVMNSQRDSQNRPLGYTMAADKHQLIYPIPEQDRLLNSNLTQNPGY